MKLETFKSILLVLLIALSLMLTFGLWNYKSDFEQLETGKNYASEVSVGGQQGRTRNNLIAPSSIIFVSTTNILVIRIHSKKRRFFMICNLG